MKKALKTIVLVLIFSIPFMFVLPVFAQANGEVQKGLDILKNSFPQGPARTATMRDLVKIVIDWALYFSAALSVIFIIVGGYIYITAGGDKDQAKKGRVALTNALVGLLMIVFSYTIVQVVFNFLISPAS